MFSVVLIFMVCGAFAGIQEGIPVEISGNTLSLDFESVQWSYTCQGKYLLVKDPRGLYQIYHPWDVSEDGDFASLSAEVTVPADWQKPIFLNLYANDTYVSEGWEQAKPRWTHTYAAYHNLVNHRFKQILIDDQVIWDQDVGDSEDFDYFSLDISEHVIPGRAFTLTLRVLGKLSSATRLPDDEFHLGIWSWEGLRDPDAEKKFYTRVFWGLTCTVPMGLRNWPDSYSDSIYSAYRGTWGNMYQEVDYGRSEQCERKFFNRRDYTCLR